MSDYTYHVGERVRVLAIEDDEESEAVTIGGSYEVIQITGFSLRLRLPDGRKWWVPRDTVEPSDEPVINTYTYLLGCKGAT